MIFLVPVLSHISKASLKCLPGATSQRLMAARPTITMGRLARGAACVHTNALELKYLRMSSHHPDLFKYHKMSGYILKQPRLNFIKEHTFWLALNIDNGQ